MAYRQEKFEFQGNEYVRMFQTSQRQKELHCHNCLEINYVECGTGTYIIGGKMYPMEPGDVFVINNSEHHLALHGEDPMTLTVLVLDTGYLWKSPSGVDYLKPFLSRNSNFSNRIGAGDIDHRAIVQTFQRLKEEYFREEPMETDRFQKEAGEDREWAGRLVGEAATNLLLALLYRYYNKKKEIGREVGKEAGCNYLFGPIEKVLSYIHEHFSENITLEQLARESSLSRTYLSKYFKEITGQTLFTYIQQTRVQYASYLLQTGRKSIAEIATDSGFETVSYFNRVFKKYNGKSPSQFREKKRK